MQLPPFCFVMKASHETQQPLEPEYERCVLCGRCTDVPISLPVDERDCFLPGAGQLCRQCYAQLEPEMRRSDRRISDHILQHALSCGMRVEGYSYPHKRCVDSQSPGSTFGAATPFLKGALGKPNKKGSF